MNKVHSDHFSCQKCRFLVFLTGVPEVWLYVSLRLSAATWLINTKTLLRISTIFTISLRNIIVALVTSRPHFVQKCRFSSFFGGGTLSSGIWCHFIWARPLSWLIPNIAKDLNYFQHKFQEHHYCPNYFQITFRVKMIIVGVFVGVP